MNAEQSPETSPTQSLLPEAPSGLGRRVVTAVGLVAVVLAVATVWSVPRPTGDLYVGLAAGREIMEGKLGQVDDWSFMNEGRVWINQNWGTNLAYWAADRLCGETGLLALKALIILMGTGFLVLACRRREASWPIALIVSAGVIAAGRSFIDLRPNLTTLMFVPVMLHLLYRTAGRPGRIWLTMLVFGVVWANLHGGFTLGLLAMFFWAFCVVILPIFGQKLLSAWVPGVVIAGAMAAVVHYFHLASLAAGQPAPKTWLSASMLAKVVVFIIVLGLWYFIRWNVRRMDRHADDGGLSGRLGDTLKAGASEMIRRKWAYLAAAFGAVVLAGVVTPYGIHNAFRDFSKLTMGFWDMWNLTHPVVVTIGKNSEGWRQVIEWNSIFTASPSTFGTSWEFFGIVGLFCTLVPIRVAVKIRRRELLDVADYVLLVVVAALCLAIIAQAQPMHVAFEKMVRDARFRALTETSYYDGILWQYRGWFAAMCAFSLICLSTVGVSLAALSAWFKRRQMPPWSAERIGIVVFDVCIAAGGIHLAFGARRFMPLALMLLAPMLARQLQWLVGWLGELATGAMEPAPAAGKKAVSVASPLSTGRGLLWHLPVLLIGLVVIYTISIQARENYNRYRTDSPIVRDASVLKNMITYSHSFPPYARDFILSNDLSGKCFNEWRWEGYLRWYCPKLKMFVGGRAQQAYSIETYKFQQDILRGNRSLRELENLEVRWIIVPWSGDSYVPLVQKAVYDKGAVWVPIFCDGDNIVLANSRLPECQETIGKCEAGLLTYPSEAIKHFSRAMCFSGASVNRPAEAVEEIIKAHESEPIPRAYGYDVFVAMCKRAGGIASQIGYLERENVRLAGMDYNHLNGYEILRCRDKVLNMLGRYYQATEQRAELARIVSDIRILNEQMGRVIDKWN